MDYKANVVAGIACIALMAVQLVAQPSWIVADSGNPAYSRNGHACVEFNGRQWSIGGYTGVVPAPSEVWSSVDGINWSAETATASWPPRYYHSVVAFNGRIWIAGGNGAGPLGFLNDVWSSSDGRNWTLHTQSAAFTPRSAGAMHVINNRMWIFGGRALGGVTLNDAWSSADGVNWIQESTAVWTQPRSFFASVVHNNRVWVIGGWNGGNALSDVWSTEDGTTWTQETSAAPWMPRHSVSAVSYNNRLWITGGATSMGTYLSGVFNDTWCSIDGVQWQQVSSTAVWPPLGEHQMLAVGDRMLIHGGYSAGARITTLWSYTEGPALCLIAQPGTPLHVFSHDKGPAGGGLEVGRFSILCNGVANHAVESFELEVFGSGNDSNAFSAVGIFRDGNQSGAYIAGVGVQVGALFNFASDNETRTVIFPAHEQQFAIGEMRTYFVVIWLAGTAMPGDSFQFRVQSVSSSTPNSLLIGAPSAFMAGLLIATPEFVFADDSPQLAQAATIGSSGNVCMAFTISYPGGPDDKPSSISVTGLGSANEALDLDAVQLWWDFDNDGAFNFGTDYLIDTRTYAQNNGTIIFDTTAFPIMQASQSLRFFVVYDLNRNAAHQTTFKCYVSAVGVGSRGGVAVGLPTPSLSGSPGLIIDAHMLHVDFNGPGAAVVVSSNAVGVSGDGVLLYHFTLATTTAAAWDVASITFQANGTGDHGAAYSELALYEDDGNTTWDGALYDTLAAPTVSGFVAAQATFFLNARFVARGTQRRFFLVGKLNGTAATGQTFNARLVSVNAASLGGGAIGGVPAPASTALIIDLPVLTVNNGPDQPPSVTHAAGSAGEYVAARFQIHALNGQADVFGVRLSGGGSGDWLNGVDATRGVQLYADDGDGVFDRSRDTLLFEGGGGLAVDAVFLHPLALAHLDVVTLWAVLALTPSSGTGVVDAPRTFQLSIASALDVIASTAVLLGTPAPVGATVGAIEFGVDSFSPRNDKYSGGAPIVILGRGLVAPLTVTIGGVICPGMPVITDGTRVEGLSVPAGSGRNLEIVIQSGNLPPQTLSQSFAYDDTRGHRVESSCSLRAGGTASGFALLLFLAGLMRRRPVRRGRLWRRRRPLPWLS
jgi:hypothetical protein